MKRFLITLTLWLPAIIFSQNEPTDCEEVDLLSYNDTSVCGQAINLTAIAGLDNYSWSTGSDNQFTSISLPGTYTVSTSYNSGNFVENGNFNEGNSNFSSSYTYSATNLYPEGTYSVTTNANNVHTGFSGFGNGGNGNFMVVNGATSPGLNVWCQDIEIEPETTYNFSTSVSTVANGNQALLQFSINGETIGTSFSAPNTTGTWSEFNATWNSNTSTNAEICIVNQNTSGGGNDFGLDNISFSTLCTSSESITVTEIDPANATIFNVDDLCESGPIVNLNAVDAGGTWTGNGISNANTGAFDPNLAGPGTHNITYTIDGACGDVNSVDVTVVQETESSITAPESICENVTPIDLQGIPGIGTWQGNGLINTSTGLFDPAAAQIGNNTISYTPDGFCMEVSTHEIEVHEIIVPETDLFHEICWGDIANLNTGDMTFLYYNWSTNENLSNINVFNDGIYNVSLTDFNDCIQELEFEVIDKDNCEVILMPNVFTPNGDYENDLFIPITYDYIPKSVLKIFNRWGVEVYYSQSIEKGWNGKHFSKDCPEGVYFWVVEFQTNTGVQKNVSGSVNLLR